MMSASRKILSLSSPVIRNVRSLSIQGIEKSDIVTHDKERDYYLVRMKPRHIPIVMPAMKEFYETENTGAAYKVKIEDEHVWPFAFNYTRYPFSTFIIDKKGEVLSFCFNDVIYRDASKDPRPRAAPYYKKGDPWMPFVNAMTYVEERTFEMKPHIDKMIDGAGAWTKPSMRQQHLSKMLYRDLLEQLCTTAADMGINDVVSLITSKENHSHVSKFGLATVETLPDSAYAVEGTELVKIPEGNARLVHADIQKQLQPLRSK